MIVCSIITNMSGDAGDIYEWLIPYMQQENIEMIEVSYLKDRVSVTKSFTADDISSLAGIDFIALHYEPNSILEVKQLPVNAYGDRNNTEVVIVHCKPEDSQEIKRILEARFSKISYLSFIINPEQTARDLAVSKAELTTHFN